MKKEKLPENIGATLAEMKKTLPAEAGKIASIESLALKEVDFVGLQSEILSKYGKADVSKMEEKEVAEALKHIRKARTTIEGRRKETASVLSQVAKTMNARAKALIEPIEAVEIRFDERKKEIEDAKIAEEERVKREALEFFNGRTQRLFDAGFVFNGSQYVAALVVIGVEEIRSLDDLGFDAVLESGRTQARRLREFMASAKSPMEAELEGREVPGTEEEMAGEPGEGVQAGGGIPPVYFARPSMPERPLDMDFVEGFGNFGPAKENGFLPNPPESEATWVDQDSPAAYRPEGYLLGFNACRNAIIGILQTEGKMKREELMEKIRNLSV